MINQDFRIGSRIVWFLILANLILTIAGSFAKILNWEHSQLFLIIGLILFFSTWIIILGDMISNNIYNRTFWLMSMFIIPVIAVYGYMI